MFGSESFGKMHKYELDIIYSNKTDKVFQK